MKPLINLIERIVDRVNINLRELDFDVYPYIRNIGILNQLSKFYAFYGITPHHPLNFYFSHSNLAGSYFLGKCTVENSILYKSDIRGDELKGKGDIYKYKNFEIPIHNDEEIRIKDSFLIKTLVHNYSHDPENLEEFIIQNTVSTHYANIHGSNVCGCFLGPFSTVDLTRVHDCVIGSFSYIQANEISHMNIESGTVWIRNENQFNFYYRHSSEVLNKYISFTPEGPPKGVFIEFLSDRKVDFQEIYNVIHRSNPIDVPEDAALDRYAVVKGQTRIEKNVLVAQRAYLEDATLGKGSNAQENCYIIYSHLEGYNVTAHGTKIINARLGEKVFVGFNSFLKGRLDSVLIIGDGSIIMPHTIIDLIEPLTIPSKSIVWGYIRNAEDIKKNSLPIEAFVKIKNCYKLGSMFFEGSGEKFIKAFRERIDHILEANGAFFDGIKNYGHAQRNQNISFNTIQPYPEGDLIGLYPTIAIRP